MMSATAAPRILAVGTAVPPTSFEQTAVLEAFGYTDPLRRRFFLRSGVERRHFFLPEGRIRLDEDLDALEDRFREGSVTLGSEAVRACLERAGVPIAEIDFLVTTTHTGRLCPSLDAHLVRALGFREDVERLQVADTGCASASAALRAACRYLRAFPGRRALVVAVEICSTAYALDDSPETAVANAMFADGAGAILLGTDGEGVAVVDHRTLIRPEYLELVGFTFPGGRPRVHLSKEARWVAPGMVKGVAERLLKDHELEPQEVRFWVLHAAGPRVLDGVRSALELEADHLRYTREVLREFGNMASVTVLFVLERVLRSGRPHPGDWGVMLSLGPGFSADAALLRW